MRSRNFSATLFSAFGSCPVFFLRLTPFLPCFRIFLPLSTTLDPGYLQRSRDGPRWSFRWCGLKRRPACSLSRDAQPPYSLSASFALLLTGRPLSSRFPWYLDPNISRYLVILGYGLLCRSTLPGAYLGAGAVYCAAVCDSVCRVSTLMLCSRSVYRLAGQPLGSLDRSCLPHSAIGRPAPGLC